MTTSTIALSNSLQALALRQWRDYQRAMPGGAFTDPELSLTLEEAYAVQMEVARLRCAAGDAVAGYKIGCIGPGMVRQFGMSGPIHARLFRSEIHEPACSFGMPSMPILRSKARWPFGLVTTATLLRPFP
jgi:2-keto-4-pentenoate hydratase